MSSDPPAGCWLFTHAAFTHAALAAHAPRAGRITLHPGPGTTSDTALASDLLHVLGKPARLPGGFPHGRPPLWEAAAAWTTALAVTRLIVLRAHLLDQRRLQRPLKSRIETGWDGVSSSRICRDVYLVAIVQDV